MRIFRHISVTGVNRRLPQRKRDLLARNRRRFHAKSPAQISFDFANSYSFTLKAFTGTGTKFMARSY